MEDVLLASELPIRFRAITPSDKHKLAEGFARLSAESRYRRFFSAKSVLTAAELQFFTEPDGINHVAIAALEIDTSGEEDEFVGIGRFLRTPEDPDVAEISLVVVDARQGMGIGRILLERLITAAAERDVRRIRCHLLTDNERMRKLIRRVLGDTAFIRDGEIMTGEFPVPAATDLACVSQYAGIAPLFNLLRLIAAGSLVSLNFGFANVLHGVILMTARKRNASIVFS
jgi:RimJ/RimL family protein N-acetyltransferase